MNIYNRNGAVIASVEVSDSSEWRKELMNEEYVSLKFTLSEHVQFKKGFFITPSFGTHRYEIVTLDRPRFNTSNGGWDYDIKFHAEWEKWKHLVLFYDRQHGNREKSWSLTQTPSYFLSIVLSNLARLGLGDNWQADIDPSLTQVKNLTFDATTIFDALTQIAQAWETEWWVEGRTIHLSKCEYGTSDAVTLEIGDIINTMEAAASGGEYATRLYAFGSTRNLPKNYRGAQSGALVEGVVEKRLMLPEGTTHVDAWENLEPQDVVEAVALFEDIYPRQVREITAVTTRQYTDTIENEDGTTTQQQWNAYRIEDDGFEFSEEYRLPDEELRVVFQTGRLAGLDFAVNFIAAGQDDNVNQCFEIIRNEDYGVPLPNDTLRPQQGDDYILYGFNTAYVDAAYLPAAEAELLAAAEAKIAEMVKDDDTYTCQTNPVRCSGYTQDEYGDMTYSNADVIDLDIGQAVSLVNPVYFGEAPRPSRVRAFTKKLTDIYNCRYEIGYSAKYSTIGSLQGEVKTVTLGSNTFIATGSGGGSTITLIRQYDKTEPTDNNAYSAKRADREFLHSSKEDTASEKIIFNKGIEAGDFTKGSNGAAMYRDISGNWVIEGDFFRVRKKLSAEEVEIMQTSHIGGRLMQTPAAMTISEREVESTYYRCYFNKEDSDGNAVQNDFAVNDLAYCETFNLVNTAYHTGNHMLWRKVINTGFDSDKQKYYIDLSKSDCLTGSDEPLVGDRIVTLGNTNTPSRQNAIIQAGAGLDSPFYRLYTGIRSYVLPQPVVQISPEGSWITVTDGNGDDVKLTDLIDSLKDEMDVIRAQSDTQIELWFGETAPTTSNAPANSWVTADEKMDHVKDIYYNRDAGLAYSWEETQSGYDWVLLTDSDVLRALEKASQAQDTADGKRRVFVARPTQAQAYDVGDLWVNATFPTEPGEVTGDAQGNEHTYLNPLYNNDILRCVTAKTAGTAFQIDHWQPVQEYYTSKIEQTNKSITLAITNGLREVGININGENNKITLNAATTEVSDDLIVKQLETKPDTTTNSENKARVKIHGSLMEVANEYGNVNIRFGVDNNGYSIMQFLNENGGVIYDLGVNGMSWNQLQGARFEAQDFYFLNSDPNAVVHSAGTQATLYIYYAKRINSTIIADGSNISAELAEEANGLWFTSGSYAGIIDNGALINKVTGLYRAPNARAHTIQSIGKYGSVQDLQAELTAEYGITDFSGFDFTLEDNEELLLHPIYVQEYITFNNGVRSTRMDVWQ